MLNTHLKSPSWNNTTVSMAIQLVCTYSKHYAFVFSELTGSQMVINEVKWTQKKNILKQNVLLFLCYQRYTKGLATLLT